MTFNATIATSPSSVVRQTAIKVSSDKEKQHLANRRRDLKWLRHFLEGKTTEEMAIAAGLKSNSTVKSAISNVAVILYYRARNREGLTKAPTDLRQVKANAAFWLEKLNANEDRMQALSPDNLPE